MESAFIDVVARRSTSLATRRSMASAIIGALTILVSRRYVAAQTVAPAEIPLGGACSVSSECSQFQGCYDFGPITCEDNGIAEDGPFNCCLGEGGLCGDDAHCCGALLCLDTGDDGCGAGTCQVGSETKPTVGCSTPVA
jgi:hypothetical protein